MVSGQYSPDIISLDNIPRQYPGQYPLDNILPDNTPDNTPDRVRFRVTPGAGGYCPGDIVQGYCPRVEPVQPHKHSLAKRDTDRLYSLLPSLTKLTSVRNLGFIIDQELNMKDHITKLCQSCYYQLRQIRTVRHSLTSSAIQTLVHAFICTRVDFSNSLLYGTSAYLLDRLQSVLNSAAHLILRIGKYDPILAAIWRDLHWLPIQFRIQYKLNSITSNCLAGRAP